MGPEARRAFFFRVGDAQVPPIVGGTARATDNPSMSRSVDRRIFCAQTFSLALDNDQGRATPPRAIECVVAPNNSAMLQSSMVPGLHPQGGLGMPASEVLHEREQQPAEHGDMLRAEQASSSPTPRQHHKQQAPPPQHRVSHVRPHAVRKLEGGFMALASEDEEDELEEGSPRGLLRSGGGSGGVVHANVEEDEGSWQGGYGSSGSDADGDAAGTDEVGGMPSGSMAHLFAMLGRGATIRFCANCTGMCWGDTCSDCGQCEGDALALLGHGVAGVFDAPVCCPPAPAQEHMPRPLLVWDERMLLHEEAGSQPHPERPDRLTAVMARLTAGGTKAACCPLAARPATVRELLAVHTREHLQALQALTAQHTQQAAAAAAGRSRASQAEEGDGRLVEVSCGSRGGAGVDAGPVGAGQRMAVMEAAVGGQDDSEEDAARDSPGTGRLPPDTYMNADTYACARLAAGSAAELAASVARGDAPCGAAIIRPPGHHAESNTAMGFCFFNNAAVAARAAQAAGARRILIVDWDVHHGNGTQHIFEDDPSVMFVSLHRYDRGNFYPGTGAPHEVGTGAGLGYTLNIAWDDGGVGDSEYLAALRRVVIPVARAFSPDLVIISAGFDAAEGDPIGGCCVSVPCFGHMAALLREGVRAPMVLLLEGGYNLAQTSAATEACLRVLLGEAAPALPLRGTLPPSRIGEMAVAAARAAHARFWPCLRDAPLRPVAALRPLPGLVPVLGRGAHRHGRVPPLLHHQQSSIRARGAPLRAGSRKLQVLRAIHKTAIRAFWQRRMRNLPTSGRRHGSLCLRGPTRALLARSLAR